MFPFQALYAVLWPELDGGVVWEGVSLAGSVGPVVA